MLPAEDTIVAIATPLGKGAISILRMSGKNALRIAEELFQRQSADQRIKPFFPNVGKIYDKHHRLLDQVVLLYYQTPKSYTGEDLVEICCHGSPITAIEILTEIQHRGGRCAEPGEFSLRAYLNGKMDLTQAESIQQLMDAQTRRQAQIAVQQIDGALGGRIKEVKEKLIQMIVDMETALEFEEVENKSGRYEERTRHILDDLNKLVQSCEKGKSLRIGKKVAIIGRPNVGKSSLFNQIVRKERAIVYHLPGTTRDTIHETLEIKGVPVTVIDTAGWRVAKNSVEREGVRRSELAMEEADIILLVIDMEKGCTRTEYKLKGKISQLSRKKELVVIWNKIDRCSPEKLKRRMAENDQNACFLSAKNGDGIDRLLEMVEQKILPEDSDNDTTILTGIRSQECLQRTIDRLLVAEERLRYHYSEEYVLEDFKEALTIMGEITGETVTEEILGRIFSKFCVGK
jgi:tRNA modification GTPase